MSEEELEKGKVHSIGSIIEYAPDGILSKTLLKRPTGIIDLVAYDAGKGLKGTVYPFDTFVMLLEGSAEITIDGKAHRLEAFNGIIIPAHRAYEIVAIERFKMLSVIVKSGYENLRP